MDRKYQIGAHVLIQDTYAKLHSYCITSAYPEEHLHSINNGLVSEFVMVYQLHKMSRTGKIEERGISLVESFLDKNIVPVLQF